MASRSSGGIPARLDSLAGSEFGLTSHRLYYQIPSPRERPMPEPHQEVASP